MIAILGMVGYLMLIIAADIPNLIWRDMYRVWKRTVPMSLARKQAAHDFKKWIAPGLLVYAVIVGAQIFSIITDGVAAIPGTIVVWALWGWIFYGDYKRMKEVLDDEDFFKKMKSKAKRWLRNTFAIRKTATSNVGG